MPKCSCSESPPGDNLEVLLSGGVNERQQAAFALVGQILAYVDQLNELDTDGVEPMMHVLDLSNVFRKDEVLPSIDRDVALANAPKTDGEYFLVPKILDND